MRISVALIVLLLVGACFSALDERRAHCVVDSELQLQVGLDELAHELSDCDVVFLGELHQSSRGHRMQLELTRRLVDLRPQAVISLEMFERDVQQTLDAYLAGKLDEQEFLKRSRPWPNYDRDYRPVVELAKRRRIPVLAANLPRRLSLKVAREGLAALEDQPFAPRQIHDQPGLYRTRFLETMSRAGMREAHADLDFSFAAQCAKDDTMAESIHDLLAGARPARPLVIHWCGSFHSDQGLGTVERLRLRDPDLRIRVLSMLEKTAAALPLSESERAAGDYVMLVGES